MIFINLENSLLNDKIMHQETLYFIYALKKTQPKKAIKSHSSGMLTSITCKVS